MKKSVSPFAALTCQEKHLKWLEYQNMGLPYTKAAVDREPVAAMPKEPEKPVESKAASAAPPPPSPTRPAPPVPDMRPRHRQYDAVIARMKQAELRTRNYTSVT